MLKNLKLYYFLVGLPYVLLLVGAAFFFEPIKRTILNNPIPHLNYAIIVIVLSGGLLILNNARRLVRQAGFLTEFTTALHTKTDATTLREMSNRYIGALACILQMVANSGDRAISHQEQAALEHELVNARSRLVRRNALPQYLTGLLVAMGLLGTFIGLLATLADISVLIGSFADIDMNNIDPIEVFKVMIERMKAPMTSMGIAFSTSMFGLLGSIIIGLMMLGIRRLQGDMFSVLSSEVARHIEIALSFESISFRGGEGTIGCYEEASDLTSRILLRIEERLAEASRVRQRALSAEIDDFKSQRADMLQILSAQTEASDNFCSQLQQLGTQLGNIFTSMEKSNSEISSQVSELTVRLSGDAKETHKLLGVQVEEQKRLKDTLDAYNVEEWLAETARLQQRALAAEIEDFKQQRTEMLQALNEQNEASKNSRHELQQIGGQLGTIFDSLEKGNNEISSQISELTIHTGADAKEAQRLQNVTSNNVRNELQLLGSQLEKLSSTTENGSEQVVSQVADLMTKMSAESTDAQQQLDDVSDGLREQLQALGSAISSATEKGNEDIAARLAELMVQAATDAKETQEQLKAHLASIITATGKGHGEVVSQISEALALVAAEAKNAQQQRVDMLDTLSKQAEMSNNFCAEIQQLGGQLGSIFSVMEKGNGDICNQLSELMVSMAVDVKESEEQHDQDQTEE